MVTVATARRYARTDMQAARDARDAMREDQDRTTMDADGRRAPRLDELDAVPARRRRVKRSR